MTSQAMVLKQLSVESLKALHAATCRDWRIPEHRPERIVKLISDLEAALLDAERRTEKLAQELGGSFR